MSTTYTYMKMADCDILKEMLLLTSIWRKISNVQVAGMSSISITTTEVLISSDEDILIDVINSYSPTHELVLRKNFETVAIDPAMKFGLELIGKIGSNNVIKGKNDAQKQAMFDNHSGLILMLMSGSLIMAHTYISGMTATADFAQDEIDEFERRLEVYIGLDLQP